MPLPCHNPSTTPATTTLYPDVLACRSDSGLLCFTVHITASWTGNKGQHLFIDATPAMSRPNVDRQFTAWTVMDLTLIRRQRQKVASKRWI